MDNVIFISTRSGKGTIELVTAGEEQLAICAPIVYLSATVNGDLTNVPTEWVQLTGTPTVTIENVNKTDSYYVAGANVGSDKLFRFYVYRNTQLEQYQDILVRTTPSDTISNIPHGTVEAIQAPDPLLLLGLPEISGDFSFDTSIAFNSEGRWITDTIVVNIPLPEMFTLSNDPLYNPKKNDYVEITVEEWNGSSWVYLTSFPKAGQRSLELSSPKRLRFGATYLQPGKGLVTYYSSFYDYTVGGLSIIVGKEVLPTMYHGTVSNSTTMVKIIYTIITLDESDVINTLLHGSVVNDNIISRIVYSILEQLAEDTLSATFVGNVNLSFNITRTSGTTIGNTTIGG